MTALLRGTTSTMREEVSRAFDDALGVAFRLVREPKVLPGGGGTQTHLGTPLTFLCYHSERERAIGN